MTAGAGSGVSFICVPTTAGQAVTSGGSGGSCGAATPVELPDSRAQQQTLLSVLPYLSFKASGLGAKPTIVVTGANVQIKKTSASVIKDGTGNLVVGDGVQYPVASTHSGSENLVVGYDDEWTGNSDAIVGQFHKVSGYSDLVAGRQNTVAGSHSVISGVGNTSTGSDSTLMGAAGGRRAPAARTSANGEGPTYFAVLDAAGRPRLRPAPRARALPGRQAAGEPRARGAARRRGRPAARSEERRVGKECRSRWSPYH